MTTIKVKLRPSTVEGRPCSVVYLVTRNRASRQITTAHRLFPHEWNGEAGVVTPTADERLKATDRHIRQDLKRLERIVSKLDEERGDYTAEDVVSEYQRLSGSASFFSFMESIIARQRQLNHKGTAKTYQSTLESFRQFRANDEVVMEDMDSLLVEDYEAWLRAKGLTPNTISFYMKILRAVYNRAVETGLTQDRKPFRMVSTRTEKTRKRAVSFREIKRIHDLELSSWPRLEFARDIFMFLFYCRGMSFVDAAYLKKSDIKGGVLTYRRCKTKQVLHIKVVPEMLDIFKRYTKRDSVYLLPLLHPNSDERKHYEAALRSINRSLKEVGKMANLDIPLTTYVSRHSWATIAKRKNIPLSVISEALGHESETTTLIYLSSIDSATIDKANSLIINGLQGSLVSYKNVRLLQEDGHLMQR